MYEKGVDVLLGAVPKVVAHQPSTPSSLSRELGQCMMNSSAKRGEMGIAHKVHFAGFIDDLTRNSLYQLADAAVFPSRYEPFGIVALEAMARELPLWSAMWVALGK